MIIQGLGSKLLKKGYAMGNYVEFMGLGSKLLKGGYMRILQGLGGLGFRVETP